jgi:hypothetical protein
VQRPQRQLWPFAVVPAKCYPADLLRGEARHVRGESQIRAFFREVASMVSAPPSQIPLNRAGGVRVECGVARVLVAEEILHQAEVRAVVGEGIATCVSRYMRVNAPEASAKANL